MKKNTKFMYRYLLSILTVILLLCFCISPVIAYPSANEIQGVWQGKIDVDNKYEQTVVQMKMEVDDTNNILVTLDGNKGIVILKGQCSYSGGVFHFHYDSAENKEGAVTDYQFDGKLSSNNSEKTINGNFYLKTKYKTTASATMNYLWTVKKILPAATTGAVSANGAKAGEDSKPIVVFDSWNKSSVFNNPVKPTTFSLTLPLLITNIANYHCNYGKGKTPGTIALQGQDGKIYGPWAAVGTPGAGGFANASWEVQPNVVIPAGNYTVVDSDPDTWSQNDSSGGRGFSKISATHETSVSPANSDFFGISPDSGVGKVITAINAVKVNAAGFGSVGKIPPPANTSQAAAGVIIPGLITILLGALQTVGGGGLGPMKITLDNTVLPPSDFLPADGVILTTPATAGIVENAPGTASVPSHAVATELVENSGDDDLERLARLKYKSAAKTVAQEPVPPPENTADAASQLETDSAIAAVGDDRPHAVSQTGGQPTPASSAAKTGAPFVENHSPVTEAAKVTVTQTVSMQADQKNVIMPIAPEASGPVSYEPVNPPAAAAGGESGAPYIDSHSPFAEDAKVTITQTVSTQADQKNVIMPIAPEASGPASYEPVNPPASSAGGESGAPYIDSHSPFTEDAKVTITHTVSSSAKSDEGVLPVDSNALANFPPAAAPDGTAVASIVPTDGDSRVYHGSTDGRDYEVRYDGKTGQWLTPEGNIFNPDSFDNWQKDLASDRQFSNQELDKMSARNTELDKQYDELVQQQQQKAADLKNLGQIQQAAAKNDLWNPGGPGDVVGKLDEMIKNIQDGKPVDQAELVKIKDIIKDRITGKTDDELTVATANRNSADFVGQMQEAAVDTATEVVTGKDSDGNFSWKGMAGRGFIDAATGGAAEYVFTPADALSQVKEGIDKGEDGITATGKAVVGAVINELTGRGIQAGVEKTAVIAAEHFPGLSKTVGDTIDDLSKFGNKEIDTSSVEHLNLFKKPPSDDLLKQAQAEYKVYREQIKANVDNVAAAGNELKPEHVSGMLSDPGSMRELKRANESVRTKFNEVLNEKIYNPTDAAVLEHLKSNGKYGDTIELRTTRTPTATNEGPKSYDLNTDRDVSAVYKAVNKDGSVTWKEISPAEWEGVYHREFAKNTGALSSDGTFNLELAKSRFKDANWEKMSPAEQVAEWSTRHNQSPTNVYSTEAARDFSTQSTAMRGGENTAVSSVSQIKAGSGKLLDAEGLASMEQYKFEHGWSKGTLTQQTEAMEQLSKMGDLTVTLNEKYASQGYKVAEVSPRLKEALKTIKNRDFSPLERTAELNKLGYSGPEEVADVFSWKIQGLKIAKK